MELSIFLAKLLGIYFLIIAAEMLIRKHDFEASVKDYATSKGLISLSGSMSLLLGIAIAICHPVYTLDWNGLITLLAYLMILKGIIRVGFPTHFQKKVIPCFHKRYIIIFLFTLVIGAYLTYSGFTACTM